MTATSSPEWRATGRSAKSLLLTVLGEFALPAGGAAWTSTLVRCARELDIAEKNARQAIARIADDGLIEPTRHGRAVRWSLTRAGRRLLESGAARIYGLGADTRDWDGRWLVVHCPPDERQLRDRFRSRMAFLGVGELSSTLFVTPHANREPQVRDLLADFGRAAGSVVLVATVCEAAERSAMVESAWDLDALGVDYENFASWANSLTTRSPADAFRSTVELVHEWRRFPFADPELPDELLPDGWPGHSAADVFRRRRESWRTEAGDWFTELETSQRSA